MQSQLPQRNAPQSLQDAYNREEAQHPFYRKGAKRCAGCLVVQNRSKK
jgi:hypothetical protein